MVSEMAFDEEAHRKEIDESTLRSESLRTPPAAHEKIELGGQTESDSDVESGKAPTFSEWDSVDDPGNPRNWPTWKKIFHTAIPALYGFVVSVLPFHRLISIADFEIELWELQPSYPVSHL
jgi:hypothetical protein